MKDRIRDIRHNADLSMRAFGERIGISSAAVAKIETGVNAPSEQTIRAICSEFSINREWLVDGVGERDAPKPFVPTLMRILNTHPALKAMLETVVDDMDSDDWAMLNELLRKAIERKNKKEAD